MENWKLFKTLLDRCINYNGTVFGGAVRDGIRHNIYSKQFYEEENPRESYNDISVSPHTLGRLDIPHDIDMLILRKDYLNFIKNISSDYCVRVLRSRDSSYIDDTIEKNAYTQNCLQVVQLVQYSTHDISIYIKIDLLIQENSDIPLFQPCKRIDFDVNSLYLNKIKGIHLNSILSRGYIQDAVKISEIYKNIYSKKAFMLHCSENRCMKMKFYGWDINFVSDIFIYYLNETYDGDCVICQEKIPDDKCRVRFKDCKCDFRICLSCLLTNCPKLNSCPLCKKKMFEIPPIYDLNILEILNKKIII